MNRPTTLTTFIIVAMFAFILTTMNQVGATELQFEKKGLSEVNPKEIITSGKKGDPAPPADPQCPMGSSPTGPVTHSTETRTCKIDGKDGVKSCYHKMVACLGGPGEPQYAHSENCGPCVPVNTQPGQTQTPTGR